MEQQWYARVEAWMEEYEKIYLVMDPSILKLLMTAETAPCKVLLLFPETLGNFPQREQGSISFVPICEEHAGWLRALYLTYEFSNRFRMLSCRTPHGNIMNYVNTGLLSQEDVLMALLYGRTSAYEPYLLQ